MVTKYEDKSLLYEGASNECYRKVSWVVMLILIARLGKSSSLCFREKLFKECYKNPYRQPTKVNW